MQPDVLPRTRTSRSLSTSPPGHGPPVESGWLGRAQRWLRAAALAPVLCAACGTTPPFAGDPDPGPYDELRESELSVLAEARADFAAGRTEAAQAAVEGLFQRRPQNVGVGAFLQEIQLARLESGEEGELPPGADPQRALARRWRQRAETSPSSAALVLAARLEDDRPAARRLLEGALELDPRCIWAHYGLAHLDALDGEWSSASAHLDDALALDPGHLPSLRLRAADLVRSGDTHRAASALREWIRRAREDPRIDPRALDAARLDLAIVLLERKDHGGAEEALSEVQDPSFERARRLSILAALEEAEGRPGRALAAARQAEESSPEDPVPLVQQALLFDNWLGDPVGALEAWERLRAGAHEDLDLSSWLYYLRAQVEIERLEERAQESGSPEGLQDLVGERK